MNASLEVLDACAASAMQDKWQLVCLVNLYQTLYIQAGCVNIMSVQVADGDSQSIDARSLHETYRFIHVGEYISCINA